MTATPNTPAGRRLLAFTYHPRSFGVMQIAAATRDLCDVAWLVDMRDPEAASMSRMLRRLGEVIDVDGLDVREVAAAVRPLRPDGILALADSRLHWTALLAEELELPFMPSTVAAGLTDKLAQRAALRSGGVPVPGFWSVPATDDADAWDALAREATFPAVLKPRSGEGSHNVVRVDSLDELRALIGGARDDYVARGDYVLEEYLRDREDWAPAWAAGYVSVEGFVVRGRVRHLAITGRLPPADPFRETGFFIPSTLGDDDRRAVLGAARAAVEAIGITVGTLHTEVKLTPDGPRVIEVNGRLGGGIAEMLHEAAGIDMLRIAMRLALGEEVDDGAQDALPPCSRVAYLLYVQAPSEMREVEAVEGLDELRADPEVSEIVLSRGPGQPVHWAEGNHGRVFSVSGVVGDHERLATMVRRVHEETHIRGR